jgi:hypothetical protein
MARTTTGGQFPGMRRLGRGDGRHGGAPHRQAQRPRGVRHDLRRDGPDGRDPARRDPPATRRNRLDPTGDDPGRKRRTRPSTCSRRTSTCPLLRRLDRLHRPSPAPRAQPRDAGPACHLEELPPKRRRTPFATPGRLPLGVPFDLPGFVLNAASLRVFNAVYYAMGKRKAGVSLIDWDRYFYPLDSIANWNRIYGRAGFYQFQCALPLDGVRAALSRCWARYPRPGPAVSCRFSNASARVRGAFLPVRRLHAGARFPGQ